MLPHKTFSESAEYIQREYIPFIREASLRWDVPPERIMAIILQESSGDRAAQGSSGEIGLMQIMAPALDDVNRNTGSNYTLPELYEPKINIDAGTAYLAILRGELAYDLDVATQAYNAGIGNVQRNPEAGRGYLEAVISKEKFFIT